MFELISSNVGVFDEWRGSTSHTARCGQRAAALTAVTAATAAPRVRQTRYAGL